MKVQRLPEGQRVNERLYIGSYKIYLAVFEQFFTQRKVVVMGISLQVHRYMDGFCMST